MTLMFQELEVTNSKNIVKYLIKYKHKQAKVCKTINVDVPCPK